VSAGTTLRAEPEIVPSAPSLNHHREGSGAPLVLLHGIGLRWQIWRPVIGSLAAAHDVIACDSPGFGRSAPLAEGVVPSIPAYVDAFEAFFAELGLERPHVAGNSMGGAIALELARRGIVASAVALSPAGFWTPAERRFCQRSLEGFARAPRAARPVLERLARSSRARRVLFWQTFARPERIPDEDAVELVRSALTSPAFAPALAAFSEYTFAGGEALDRVPITVAWGTRDRLLPYRRQAPRARALLPGARHLSLGVGHVPFFDDPAVIVETISSGVRA
jgi:pimeloyl-ACP methyl ester carboxylesterase